MRDHPHRGGRRVAVTGLRGIPGIMGGVETHCEELLPRLHDLDPSLDITVFGRAPYMAAGEQSFGAIRVVPLPAPRRQSLEAIASTLSGIVAARRRGARLIHIHAIGPALLAPFARLLGLKVLVTHHGTDYERAKWGRVARAMLRLGEWSALRTAHAVICVAPSLTARLKARFPGAAGRIHYIPNGAPAMRDDAGGTPDALATLGLAPKSYILAVGRLVPEKGFDYLVDAYRRSGSDKALVIVGAADHESEFSAKLLAQGDDRVRFLGQQPRHVLRRLYGDSALFVLPSFHEGLPIVALEAAHCAAPILLSDIEPNLNVGLPPANYFPAGDVEALAAALRGSLDRYAVDAAAVRQRFDWDDIAARTLAIYQHLLT